MYTHLASKYPTGMGIVMAPPKSWGGWRAMVVVVGTVMVVDEMKETTSGGLCRVATI